MRTEMKKELMEEVEAAMEVTKMVIWGDDQRMVACQIGQRLLTSHTPVLIGRHISSDRYKVDLLSW